MNKSVKRRRLILMTVPVILVLVTVAAILLIDFDRSDNVEDTFVDNTIPDTIPDTEPPTLPPPTEPTTPTPPPIEEDPEYSRRWDDEDFEEIIDPRPRGLLTGLPIEEEYLNRRPIAVVINNIHRALPQSGITSADIIYEVLSEGDVTRLVGIFQSYMPEKIGPVRSTRDYFVDFAFNHDALFIHHGGSPTGYSHIRNTGITNLDGMALEGTVFWRDRTYPEWHHNTGTRPMEHSSYTSWERITNHMNSRNIRNYVNDNPAYGFTFGTVPRNSAAGVANTISVPFSPGYVRTFIFDPETQMYLVENRDGPHKDAITAEQVAVVNVLIQLTSVPIVDGEGRRVVQTIGEGEGFFATGGQYVPVRWAKDRANAPMRWYFEDGSPLILAPGVTWINVFQSNGTVTIE